MISKSTSITSGLGGVYDSGTNTLTITGLDRERTFIFNFYMNDNTTTSRPEVQDSSGYTVVKSLEEYNILEGVTSQTIIGMTTSTVVSIKFTKTGTNYLFSAYQA